MATRTCQSTTCDTAERTTHRHALVIASVQRNGVVSSRCGQVLFILLTVEFRHPGSRQRHPLTTGEWTGPPDHRTRHTS